MKLLYIAASLSILLCGRASRLQDKMEANGVVPDVIDQAPPSTLSVTYPGGKQVNLGAELTPTEVKDAPTVKWDADPSSYYTLAMVDPDAPSRADPKIREVNHWLVGNIPGSDVSKGDVIAAYRGSGPPKGTGLHRYIFLLYKQNGKVEFDEQRISATTREPRFKFSARKFAQKYGLGSPIAGNFFQAQWDEFVDIRNKNEGRA